VLYLNPPFLTHEGIVIGSDYGDPTQFWYFPGDPRIATDKQGRPAIRFLIYKDLATVNDEDATVGFLFFDTVLSLPDAAEFEERAAAKVKQTLGIDKDVRVSPMQFKSGRVELIFLDRKEGAEPPPAGEPENADDWVTVIQSAGRPSLYGENRAIFSVGLTKRATTLLMNSFEGFMPIGVVYDLTYVGMQRAFQVKIDVKWNEFYQYVRERTEDRVLFWSEEVEEIVAELESKTIIQIQGSIEGVGDEGMAGEYAEVRKSLTQWVFEKFFEAKIRSQDLVDGNTGDNVMSFLGALRDGGLPAKWGCTKKTVINEEHRDLDVDYTVEKAVERPIAAQAHLSAFWEEFGLTKDDVITVVNSEDSIWETTSLRVLGSAEFGDTGVDRIIVDIAYGEMIDGEPGPDAELDSVVLDASHTDETVENWYDPAFGNRLHYRYRVAFGANAVVGDSVLMQSKWLEATEGVITVNPLELYQERSLEFQRSALLPTEMFPEVLAHLRYTAPDDDWTYQDSSLLTSDSGSTWKPTFRLARELPDAVDYRLEYARATGDVIDSGWKTTTESMVVARDPRENLFPVRVLVGGDRQGFEQILIDLDYMDEAAGTHETKSFNITKDDANATHEWAFPRAALDRTTYRYNQVVVEADGTVTSPGWVQSDAPTLVVGKVFAAKWSIIPHLVGPPLADNGLERIVVTIDYEDAANDYREHSEQTLTVAGRGTVLALELKDATKRSYTYRVRYVFANGFEKKLGPSGGSDTFLMISSIPPAG
jgi:hypothetical protein